MRSPRPVSGNDVNASQADLGFWERMGTSLPAPQRQRLVKHWLRVRIVVALLLATIGAVLGLWWQWSEGWAITALASVSAVEAAIRLKNAGFEDPVLAVFVDITAIYLGMSIALVPDSALGVVFAYLVLSSLLLLPPRLALLAMGYSAIWYAAVVQNWTPRGAPLSVPRLIITGAITATIFLAAFVGLVTVMIQIMNRNTTRYIRRSRIQEAIAHASNALLDDRGDDALRTSLVALLEATDASSVFLDMNEDHPQLGLCAKLVMEVVRDGVERDRSDERQLVPWQDLSGADTLASGASHVIRFRPTTSPERSRHARGNAQSELNIPIFVRGEWWGIVGLSDALDDKRWDSRDERLLFAAADMIGAYVERNDVQMELEALVADLDSQVRYHHALADCARALETASETDAVDRALAELLRATDADHAYIDENFHDPEKGPSYRIIHEVRRPGSPSTDGEIQRIERVFAEAPTSYEALVARRPVHIRSSELTGTERTQYAKNGVLSELRLPIHVGGEWRGSIAFADYQEEREWSALEVRALETASQMIGSHWDRTKALADLSKSLDAQRNRLRYEKAIADCSKALLTSEAETAVDDALGYLMHATRVDRVIVDVNTEDPELGLIAVVESEVVHPELRDLMDEEILTEQDSRQRKHRQIAYAALPSLHDQLSHGSPSVVNPRLLGASERLAYLETRCKTELRIPIMSRDEWVGSIGFSDYLEEREWSADEVALLQTAAEMISAFWERNAARRRLEELVRSKDAFVAAVSHELRTPLTSVVGLAAELRDRHSEFSAEEAWSLIEVIAEQSTEVADIVNDLLVAARADIGTLAFDLKPVDVGEATRSILRSRLMDRFKHVEVYDVDVHVVADPTRLKQILRNLLVNAVKYGGEKLQIGTVTVDRQVLINVADDGAGVNGDLTEQIFQPYSRAHDAPTQPESVGLGLAVARELARMMGGDLQYQREGSWTRFVLNLPLAKVGAELNEQ